MAHPLRALGATLLVQTLASLVLTTPAVLAPVVAPELGYAPERVGLFVGTAYLAAMLSGLFTGRGVASFGAVRTSQFAMLVCAIGAIATVVGQAWALLFGAVTIGIAYGLINPAAATLLNRHSPLAHRGLFFSIKQTGVPLGVAASGLLAPLGLRLIGWQPSVVLEAAACLLTVALLVPLVVRLEPERANMPRRAAGAKARAGGASTAGLRTVLRDPALLRLSLMSFTFAFTQLCFITFLVSYLKLELGRSLALAAGILAGSQVISSIFRIAWGHVADRWVMPERLLGVLGLAMAAACLGLAALGQDSSTALIVGAAIFCAATAMGWNGVFFAVLARHASHADLAAIAGGSQFFTFCGSMSGPVVLAEIIHQGGSYATGYATLAILPALAGGAMLLASRRQA